VRQPPVKWSTTAEILRNIDLAGITDGREINTCCLLGH
jgi:hypothetical protein